MIAGHTIAPSRHTNYRATESYVCIWHQIASYTHDVVSYTLYTYVVTFQ